MTLLLLLLILFHVCGDEAVETDGGQEAVGRVLLPLDVLQMYRTPVTEKRGASDGL